MKKISLKTAADLLALKKSDARAWAVLSCPTAGVRFDARTLELLDTDRDGRIRREEILAAIDFLVSKGVDLETLFKRDPLDAKRLADVRTKLSDLANLEMSEDDRRALEDWKRAGTETLIAISVEGEASSGGAPLGLADMAAAEAALAAVEPVVDAFFTPPDDMPLVTDEPDRVLPLGDRLNPKHLESILDFATKCVRPLLGERTSLTRLEWKRLKASFAPYRAWRAAEPVVHASAKAALEEEERLIAYRLHLLEFLENFVTMRRLREEDAAIFQTGTLKIDGRFLDLSFHVEAEAAHAALAEKSKCCLVYYKMTRPSDKAERLGCSVVTRGTLAGLYAGRNGVFTDRDGTDWEATVTRVVEAQVSLVEAFWLPWRKVGEAASALVKKTLGDRQAKHLATVQQGATGGAQAGGAALASSVAAVGIGVGMLGAAAASVISAVKGLQPWWMIFVALAAVVAVVSVPSVILAWFKLRARDLGAVLNAGGWAVNRPIRIGGLT